MRISFKWLPIFFALVSCSAPEEVPVPPPAPCTSYVGLDVKAITSPNFPRAALLKAFEGVRCQIVSFPYGTFGDSLDTLDALIEQNRKDPTVTELLIRVDLYNATCLRHDSCAKGDLFWSTKPERLSRIMEKGAPRVLVDRAIALRDMCQATSGKTRCLVSFGLEDNLSGVAIAKLDAALKAEWSEIELVSNPMSGVRNDGASHHEVHGLASRCLVFDMISQDGSIADDGDTAALFGPSSDCFARMAWRPEWQGRKTGSDGEVVPASVPPRDRKFEFTEEEATKLNGLLKAAL